jgi:hypothetical protein
VAEGDGHHKKPYQPGLMVHTYNLSTEEAEVGGSQVQSQPELFEILLKAFSSPNSWVPSHWGEACGYDWMHLEILLLRSAQLTQEKHEGEKPGLCTKCNRNSRDFITELSTDHFHIAL